MNNVDTAQGISNIEVYRRRIESGITANLEWLVQGPLCQAFSYSLLETSSNRFRSILTLMTGKAAGGDVDLMDAAVGVECLVTAAKTADDLPSMDNSSLRERMPSVHMKFGSATGLLVVFSLISAANRCFARQAKVCQEHLEAGSSSVAERFVEVVDLVGRKIGASGACLGQYWDLHVAPPQPESRMVEIIDAKTGALYEMAAEVGWLFGFGELSLRGSVGEAGERLGRIMQMQDDVADRNEDAALDRPANLAAAFGCAAAESRIRAEIHEFELLISSMPFDSSDLRSLSGRVLAHFDSNRAAASAAC